jgi:hypothetical protein
MNEIFAQLIGITVGCLIILGIYWRSKRAQLRRLAAFDSFIGRMQSGSLTDADYAAAESRVYDEAMLPVYEQVRDSVWDQVRDSVWDQVRPRFEPPEEKS